MQNKQILCFSWNLSGPPRQYQINRAFLPGYSLFSYFSLPQSTTSTPYYCVSTISNILQTHLHSESLRSLPRTQVGANKSNLNNNEVTEQFNYQGSPRDSNKRVERLYLQKCNHVLNCGTNYVECRRQKCTGAHTSLSKWGISTNPPWRQAMMKKGDLESFSPVYHAQVQLTFFLFWFIECSTYHMQNNENCSPEKSLVQGI